MPDDPHSRAPASLLYLVKRLELVIRAQLDDMLRGSGTTTLQYTAMTVLDRTGTATAAQLARDSFVSPQAMADMVRSLEQRKLIRRFPNPANGRELLIALTDRGHAFLADFADAASALEAHMTDALGPRGEARFRAQLEKSRRALQGYAPRGLS